MSKIFPEYIGASPTITTVTGCGIDVGTKQVISEVTDEAAKKVRSHTDLFGNTVKTILGYGSTNATTTFEYNVLGQRTKATDPRGLNTTYTYGTRGVLTAKTSPDAGTVQSKYDQAGNLRYAQDANQAAAGQVHFTTYDFANRPLVSGQGAASFSSLNPFTSAGFETTTGNWLVVRAYDATPTNVFPWSLFWTQISPLSLSNVTGRLTAVASKSNGSWQVTLFSYDTDGRVVKRYQYTHANGGTTVLTALNTTDTLTLDLQGAVTRRHLTVGSNTWYQWFDYDTRGLLWNAFASTSAIKPGTPDVTYTYRPSGQVENRQFLGGPLVPVRYTIREQLEKIGDPAVTTYPFSARYAYHSNGTVSEAEFYSAGSPAAQKRYKYVFGTGSYDALNRLMSADFSSWSGSSWTSTLAHDLTNITYDAAGNLKTLRRYRETATLIDNLTYTYPSSSNRLSSVSEAVGTTAEPWDAEAGSFTYDANGNLKTAPAPYSIAAITYDHQNLPLSLTRSGTTTTYRYDEAGQRLAKQVGSGNREMYLLAGALTLGVVTVNSSGTPVSWFFNGLAGDKVIGRQPNTGNRRYYHTDLLGSTRAVVEGATVVESYDFEPWGLLMPGRTLAGPTKEGFTGKEQDAETGLDYFGARYYMPALGRWTAVDPLAEKHPEWSPYNYVLNNPLVLIDPDGETPWLIGAFIGAAVEIGAQVAIGLASGKNLRESVQSIDLADVGTAAVAGALTGGVSAVRSIGTAAKVAVTVGTSVVEGAVKAETGTTRTEYSGRDAVLDAALPIIGGQVANEVASGLRTTSRGRALANEARRAENIAAEGRPRPAQTQRADDARRRLQNYGRGPAAQAVQAAATGSAATILHGPAPAQPQSRRSLPIMTTQPTPPPSVIRSACRGGPVRC